jgi:uncharacterized membrane protein
VTGALVIASAICFLLLATRAWLTGQVQWTWCVWNLFLAWIPFGVAVCLCRELDRPGARWWKIGGLFVVWVLFFPNAAYIVTDLIHLKNREPIPRWFDYILITAYAWTGLFLCYVSLRLLHARVQQWRGPWMGWAFATTMLAAGSLGIYVGRFLRWNSWDVITRPWKPLRDLVKFTNPSTLFEAVAFCGAFFLLSILVYLVLHALAHLHAPIPAEVKSESQTTR